MPNEPQSKEARSRQVFGAAPKEIQEIIKKIMADERKVQHLKRRILPDGEGIHEALLRHIKEVVS